MEMSLKIKETCGIGYVALVFSVVYWALQNFITFKNLSWNQGIIIGTVVLAIILLARMHFKHVARQHSMMMTVIQLRENLKTEHVEVSSPNGSREETSN